MSLSGVLSGNVSPSRFVKQSTTSNRTFSQCGAGEKCIGISQAGTHLTPLLGLDDGYAGVAGESIQIYTKDDEDAWLEMGGTVAAGDLLKSDADGKGVTASTGNWYGDPRLVAGTSGQVVKVQPSFGTM